MAQQPEIQWQPISQLPLLGSLIDEMCTDSADQLSQYQEVNQNPHRLDNATVQRAIRLYAEQLEDIEALYGPQFGRWLKDELTDAQRAEVTRLSGQLAKLKAINEQILGLLDDIKHGTIDWVL